MKRTFLLFLAFALMQLSIFAQEKTSSITFHEEIKKTQDSFLQHIPIGTSLSDAKTILKKNKIAFEVHLNQDFTNKEKTVSGKNYLYIDKIKSKGWVSRRWQVAIIYEDEKVSEIIVSYGLIGS